jgi:hypothetical protein
MTGAASPSPTSAALPWLPFGLGVMLLLVGGVVATLLGAWEVVMGLCIECPRRDSNWVPGLALLTAALLAGGGGGLSLWLTVRAERRGDQPSGLLIPAGALLVVAAAGGCATAVGWLVYVLR